MPKKDTKIYVKMLELFKSWTDPLTKSTEQRLLSISDFVAAEAKYRKNVVQFSKILCQSTIKKDTHHQQLK